MIVSNTNLPAVLVEGNLRISGNPEIIGTSGSAHTNGTLDFDGTPCAAQYFSSSGSIIDPDKGKTGSCPGSYVPSNVRAGEDLIEMPLINPADFQTDATHILGTDGKIRNQAGTDITILTVGWKYSSGIWESDGDSMTPGTYYSTSRIKLGANTNGTLPGNNDAVSVTIITTKYIDVSGNPTFTPNLLKNGIKYSMIAGTDIDISGNPEIGEAANQGVHYAGHQISISGNPDIFGQVLAADSADIETDDSANDLWKLVNRDPGGYMRISGNPTISYSGGQGLAVTSIDGWREVR
jgi:hypothetical protein